MVLVCVGGIVSIANVCDCLVGGIIIYNVKW